MGTVFVQLALEVVVGGLILMVAFVIAAVVAGRTSERGTQVVGLYVTYLFVTAGVIGASTWIGGAILRAVGVF